MAAAGGPSDVLVLAELHLDVLYEMDDGGRYRGRRDPDVTPPLAHFFRTTAGNRWAVGRIPDESAATVGDFFRRQPTISEIARMESTPPSLEAAPRGSGGHALFTEIPYRGPAFVARRPVPMPPDVEIVTRVTDLPPAFAGTLAWVSSVQASALPVSIARDAGQIVAVCHAASSSDGAAEAGVETDEPARRRGFGTAVAAAWVAAVQAQGRLALYSTTWSNLASRRIAAHLGLECYGEDVHFR